MSLATTTTPPLWWIVIHPSGHIDRHWAKPTLPQLQRAVGGYIEAIPNRVGAVVYANEEGRMEKQPVNPYASAVLGLMLVGPVVVMGPNERRITPAILQRIGVTP